MSSDLKSPNTLTTSLNDQIREAGYRLQNRRRLVRVRGAKLGRALYQRITAPAGLLWTGGGMGFLLGELTQRPKPQLRDRDHAPDSGYPFFESVLNWVKLVYWGNTVIRTMVWADE